jgi:pyruvate dehydrogenase E2 component (dihydrolipoamide acetyltransferase)
MQTAVMPKMGDTMVEGKLLTWHKHEGDEVEKGESLAEIETEKVNIEAESFFSGTLRKVLVAEGQTVPVGAPIALIGTPDEPLPAEYTGGPARTAASAQPGPGAQTSATSQSRAPQIATQPATVEDQTSPAQPTATPQPLPQPQPVGAGAYAAAPAANGHAATALTTGRTFISPIARRIAQEHQLDISRVPGTGPNGRIIRDDVEAYLAQQRAAYGERPETAPVPQPVAGEEVEVVPLSAMRRTIARRLQQSMQTAPHFYVTMSVETTRLAEFRHNANEYAEALPEPIKISVNDLIVKALALALSRMPQINVSFDGERLLVKKHVNVGVAVALEQGLIVPVIRDADKRSILEIARESRRLAEAARGGKLKPEEFEGGTFSVSNLGMYEVEEFTAVINPPESAILAVGAITPTPVVVDGQVAVRDRMKMTLSVDHRAIDGAQAAQFLREVKRLLEQPMAMML